MSKVRELLFYRSGAGNGGKPAKHNVLRAAVVRPPDMRAALPMDTVDEKAYRIWHQTACLEMKMGLGHTAVRIGGAVALVGFAGFTLVFAPIGHEDAAMIAAVVETVASALVSVVPIPRFMLPTNAQSSSQNDIHIEGRLPAEE
jgi:hypothetical protein